MKQIKCPICNQRLFDAKDGASARIDIKCNRCGKIIQVELNETTELRKAI